MISLNEEIRTGVYVCHCGTNIDGVIPVETLTDFASGLPNVTLARHYKYMCSDPGQELVKVDIGEHRLNRIVVCACSPLLHEKTFRKAIADAGLNPFLLQIANIREHVSWVTTDAKEGLRKAKAQLAAAVRRVAGQEPLEPQSVPVTQRVLVVGGGIAGIQAALTLAQAKKEVVLVERQPSIGGHMAMFDKTFPTLDCAACILTPKMTDVKDHPNIKLLTYAEVDNVDGSVGNFHVKVRRRARYIDEDLCVGCMQCIDECIFKTGKVPNEFDQGLGNRKPVYVPFPQAVPPVPVIDRDACIEFKTGKCKKTCIEACGDRNAIDLKQEDRFEEYDVGTIIVATGYKAFDASKMAFYGYGRFPNVYTSLEVERLLNSSGPTMGKVELRDGGAPKRVGIVHCVGSRDENHHEYCSRVCCMYSLKLAHLLKEKTDAEVYNFYIDIRTPGKGFEEFYNRTQKEGVYFIRGKVGDVSQTNGHTNGTLEGEGPLTIRAEDTILGKVRNIGVDMVVLATGLEPREDADEVRRLFGISCSNEGFFLEKHPKLAPVNTASEGVLIAGACQGPKDIPDTVAQADAAAAKALAMLDQGAVELEPNTAYIDEEACSGCRTCVGLCPYTAIGVDPESEVSKVDEALCQGCGTCVAACPSVAIHQHMYTDEQIYEELEGLLSV